MRLRSTSAVPTTRSEAVAAELRRLIQTGELGPGERLRQVDIAARFGVSTTPVREAFSALAKDGLVRQDAHRGVVVFQPSLAELAETFEIRQALEALATTMATDGLTDEDIAALQRLITEMRTAQPHRYVELNHSFHRLIYGAASRGRLLDMIEQLREVAAYYLAISVRQYDPAFREQAHTDHEAILAALIDRDGARAGQLVYDHLRHSSEHIARLVEPSCA